MTDERAHGDVVGMGMACDEIVRLEQALAEKDRAYHTLMEKAVKFARRLDLYSSRSMIVTYQDVKDFLASPEVQAWREQEGKP